MAFESNNKKESFKNIIVFDIETIPDTTLAGELCDIPENELKNMQEQDLREEMRIYHLEKHNNEFLRQPFHRIACISFLCAKIELDDKSKKEKYILEKLDSCSSFKSTEEEVVKTFWKLLEEKKPRIISFNGRMFDMNVLKCKALKYGIDCGWYFNYGGKFDNYEYPYSDSHFDLLYKYGHYTLHEICILLNIPCKIGVDGSHVAEYFDDKKYNEIREYCETDVLATYLVYLRMALVQGLIDKTAYNNAIEDVEKHMISVKNKKKGLKEFLDSWYKLNPNGFKIK